MAKLLSVILPLFFSLIFHSFAESKVLSLTVVYDNNPYRKGLETRWGFSCFIEGTERSILFDVGGEGPVLLKNMAMLKIDPSDVDVIVLSHIHYDHIGGLSSFLEKNSNVTVYMPNSFPLSIKDVVKNACTKLIKVKGPLKISTNVFSTGELGSWIKEESLIIKTNLGLIIITGCAHPGVVNIVKKAKAIFNSTAKAYMVIGGFHLSGMGGSQIRGIVNYLKKEGVKKVAPCHCSGDLARKIFKKEYGNDFIPAGAGKRIELIDAFPPTTINKN